MKGKETIPEQTKAWIIMNPKGQLLLHTIRTNYDFAWDNFMDVKKETLSNLQSSGYKCVPILIEREEL